MSKKRNLTTLFVALLTVIAVKAQNPMVLGENHAMLRLEQNKTFLLLPVQEKAENAHIAMLDKRNEMVKRMNVKLAVDKVDYFVPLAINQAQLLDISFQGDRRMKGDVKDFVCWREMKYSNTFDTTNSEKFRPLYHHTPTYGWMNDPNGMFYKDGV